VNPVAPIYAGQLQNGVIWIRIEGKGSFKNSTELKTYVSLAIKKGAMKFVIDLENCPVMDSTFMGTLVGINRSLSNIEEGGIDVINANTRNQQLLTSLGIDKLLRLDLENKVYEEFRYEISKHIQNGHYLDHEEVDNYKNAIHSLEAHKELTKAEKSNVPRFKDVIIYLEQDLKNKTKS
tara:strand:- start:2442 stop:2978 length:537 start_codon:yes stop_codon:yes gene_type:complete